MTFMLASVCSQWLELIEILTRRINTGGSQKHYFFIKIKE